MTSRCSNRSDAAAEHGTHRRLPLRRLPATSHLLSLEAAIRNGSITDAARELCLTQSAVSKQISQLECQVGTSLIQRTPTGVLPTAAGKQYLAQVAPLLIALEDATVALMTNRGHGRHLRLCVAPSFASFWLLPRLAEFQQRHPEILVDITTQGGIPDLIGGGFDAAIVNALPTDKRYRHEPFLTVDAYAVYATSLSPQSLRRSPQASDVASLPLLHQTTLPHAWREYFLAAGLPNHDAAQGPRYSTLSLGLQAALAGLGCALLPDYVTQQAVDEGKLCRVPTPAYRVPTPYSLMYAQHDAEQPSIVAFKNWLLHQSRPASSL
ncbi:MAG TPA: LysR substrate-binding domain-containing protein [Burkholderiaceae bacterium]|nr:LysR substrate-binding domain-containing protein [Burkholderiaceae bacterium]